MWRRIVSSHLKTLATASDFAAASSSRRFVVSKPVGLHLSTNRSIISASSSVFPRHFSSESAETSVKKNVEDVMPIATGHEREELEAELEGRRLLDIDYPEGPFGTKDSPAVVKSYYDKRIVGCPGGEGEDEHDVVWFWLEKGKSFECPVCSQYFELEVVGPGGPPDGHGDDEDHHH
ncbi:Cytochrome c oxidase subunit Vb [Arabidopsis thaliana x Arabidopsis arenosa]|uniref:Cytochrome c oxidase subunit Vb n=1 Tax=Arabidopsis thaliana x Arabidopsis arenosa TaxID=1240361 RepID=A0A8T2C9Q5_9BRAS|nr:Cytochrome c oxidase subunit Vb [Arabidopsis thaliana x Arabidopsis arenosa]